VTNLISCSVHRLEQDVGHTMPRRQTGVKTTFPSR